LKGFNEDGRAEFILPAYTEGDRQLDLNQHAAEEQNWAKSKDRNKMNI
jgi:hypothetical protein